MSGHSDVQLSCKRQQQSLGVLRVWGEGPVGYPAGFPCHHCHLQGDQPIMNTASTKATGGEGLGISTRGKSRMGVGGGGGARWCRLERCTIVKLGSGHLQS